MFRIDGQIIQIGSSEQYKQKHHIEHIGKGKKLDLTFGNAFHCIYHHTEQLRSQKEKRIHIRDFVFVPESIDHNSKVYYCIDHDQTIIKDMCRSVLCDKKSNSMPLNDGNTAIIYGTVTTRIGKSKNHKSDDRHDCNDPDRNLDSAELGNRKENK